MTNVWTDPIDRVGSARKRHLYESTSGGALLTRRCGTVDKSRGATSMPKATKSELDRIDALDFAKDPNACQKCLTVAGLDDVDVPSQGAANVDADPFGVFSDDGELNPEFTLEGERDPSDRVEPDAEPGPDRPNPGGDTAETPIQAAVGEIVIDGERHDIEDVELTFDENDLDPVDEDAVRFDQTQYEGELSFTLDVDAMPNDALAGWLALSTGIPRAIFEYCLDRPGCPDDPTSEDAIQGLKAATRYAEQSDDVRRSTGLKVSEAFHELKNAVDAGDADV